jgi:phosphohistidine phosphatase SixA
VKRIALALVCAWAAAAPAAAQEAVFVVRHAERADQSADARLSADGEARAAALARRLRAAGITHVYTTDLRRTIDTARPFATANHLTPEQLPAGNLDALVGRVTALPSTERALVVGHSNTVPELLRRLGAAEDVTIADSQYDDIFVVVPREHGASILLRLKY